MVSYGFPMDFLWIPRYLGTSGRLWSSHLDSALEAVGDAMDSAAPGESLAEPSDSAAVDGSRWSLFG